MLESFNCVQIKKMSSGSFKNLSTKCVNKSYLIYMYKENLASNNLQWLICHKTQLSQMDVADFNLA